MRIDTTPWQRPSSVLRCEKGCVPMQPPQHPPEQSPRDAPYGDDDDQRHSTVDGDSSHDSSHDANQATAAPPTESQQQPQSQARPPMSRRTRYLILAGVLLTAFVCGP